MGNKNVSALTASLNAPPTMGGVGSPVSYDNSENVGVEFSAASETVAGNGSKAAKDTLHLSVALVIVGLVALWFLGGIVFRNANLG